MQLAYKYLFLSKKILSKFIKLKYGDLNNEVNFKYNQYRNLLSTLLKTSKQSYLLNYFHKNVNNLKTTYKNIEKLISQKKTSTSISSVFIENDISNASTFNKYYLNISSLIYFTIKFSRNRFNDFLLPDI